VAGQAEHLADSLSKGDRVMVTGRLRQRSWETPEVEKRSVTKLEADEVGASLKWATAKVERSSQRGNGDRAQGGSGRPSGAATSTTRRRRWICRGPAGVPSCSSPASAWPKGPARPSRPCSMRPSTPSPTFRGVKDTSRGGKYHNKRQFVALAGELGLAWPDGQRPHPVIGFSDVILSEQTLADYADTLAYLGAAIRLYRDTFRRLRLLGGQSQGEEQGGQDGEGQPPTGKAGERFKVACGCQPPRSFWIRANQYTP
jgi:single-stranded DNA-binding protein